MNEKPRRITRTVSRDAVTALESLESLGFSFENLIAVGFLTVLYAATLPAPVDDYEQGSRSAYPDLLATAREPIRVGKLYLSPEQRHTLQTRIAERVEAHARINAEYLSREVRA